MKNRQPDILPFDHNRILLPSTKDDYINASKLESLLKGGPSFIATQCPLNSTISDFWVMIWEQQVEVLVCLLTDIEVCFFIFFPKLLFGCDFFLFENTGLKMMMKLEFL